MGPEFLEGVLVGSEKWIEAGGKKLWVGRYHEKENTIAEEVCFGANVMVGK